MTQEQEKQPPMLSGNMFLEWLYEQGVIPEYTRRVVIDAGYRGAVTMYVEQFADIRLTANKIPQQILDAGIVLATEEETDE